MFGLYDHLPNQLRSHVIYKLSCTGCYARHVDEVGVNFTEQGPKQLIADKPSNILQT